MAENGEFELYYLYRHIRQDKNEVFYIGIGTKNEQDLKYHTFSRSIARNRRNKHWKNIVNLNPDYEVEIVLEINDFDFIKQKEREFIKLYGRADLGLGTLVNMTDGGEGSNGFKHTVENRKKMSFIQVGKSKNRRLRKINQRKEYRLTLKKQKFPRAETHKTNLSLSLKEKGTKPVIRILDNVITEYSSLTSVQKALGILTGTLHRYIKYNREDMEGGIWKEGNGSTSQVQ